MSSSTDLQRFLVEEFKENFLKVRVSPVANSATKHVDDMFVPVHMNMNYKNETLNTNNPEQFTELLEEVFLNNTEDINTVCLVGQEGMGKTIFCKMIISKWCETILAKHEQGTKIGKDTNVRLDERIYKIKKHWRGYSKTLNSIMQRFSYAFYVSLKYVEQGTTIEEMIVSQLLEKKHVVEFEKVIENETNKCLYIVDGLDEWCSNGQGCAGVPERKHKCPTIFTTRPWKMTEKTCNSTYFDTQITLTRIDKDLADWMADIIIKSMETPESFTSQRPECNSFYFLCPMLWRCAVSVWIHEGKKQTPKSLTELYTAIVDWNLALFAENIMENVDDAWKSFPEILSSRQTFRRLASFVQKLAHFSFDLLGRKLDFTDNDLAVKYKMTAGEIQVCHALGVQKTTFKENQSITGIHRSFQEFFAAIHLAICQDKLKDLFDSHTPSLEFNMDPVVYVLIFLSGFNPENVKQIIQSVEGLRGKRKRKIPLKTLLLQQINTQNVLSKCMKEARSFHEKDEPLSIKSVCLSISNDPDILECFSLDAIEVLAVQTVHQDNLRKFDNCKNLRAILIEKESPDRWKSTNGQRSLLINRLLQEQRCLGRIQITDVTLEAASLVYLLCELKTLSRAVFSNVKRQNVSGHGQRVNVMKHLKLLYVHRSEGIVDTICEARSLKCLIISDLSKLEEMKYIKMRTPVHMAFITASPSDDPTLEIDEDEGFSDENEEEHQHVRDIKVVKEKPDGILKNSYRWKKFITPKTYWPVYDFSYLYVEDLHTDFNKLLHEIHLKTSTRSLDKCFGWKKELPNDVTVVAIDGAIEVTNKIVTSTKACVEGTDISLVNLNIESQTGPIVVVAFHQNVDSMADLCMYLQQWSIYPICVIISETHSFYNFPSAMTRSLNDKEKLSSCINDLLERFAFGKVYQISMLLQNILLATKKAEALKLKEKASADPMITRQWQQDYISYLWQLDLEPDGIVDDAFIDSHINEVNCREDRIEDIRSKISIMYEQSQIPDFERPAHVQKFSRKTLENDKVSEVLKVKSVVGVGESFGEVCVYVDKESCKEEQENAQSAVRAILDTNVKFRLTAKEMHYFNHVGASVGRTLRGTLGCFAFMNKSDFCALISAHVLKGNQNDSKTVLVGRDERGEDLYGYYTDKCINPEIEPRFDISALKIDEKQRHLFNHHLKDASGKPALPCELFHFKTAERIPYLVHIWGAVSSPGLGEICANAYSCDVGRNLIRIRDRSRRCIFSAEGDSGAIICAMRREGGMYVMAMLMGKHKEINERKELVETEDYIALELEPGIEFLERVLECGISLCTD